MASGPRAYTQQTIKRLYGFSGNQCAFPGCTHGLVNQNNALDGNICHIEGAKEGSARYNEQMTDHKRADYHNLILFCVQHHNQTDDTNIYTVKILKEMKNEHEALMGQTYNSTNPSMLLNAITALSSINNSEIDESESLNAIDPAMKLTHNAIKNNYYLIQEHKIYHSQINQLYSELELAGSIKKERLLNTISTIYTKIKGKYIKDQEDPMKSIRENSDIIFDEVYEELYSLASKLNGWEEDIIFGIRLIMVDAFIRCKILEEPTS